MARVYEDTLPLIFAQYQPLVRCVRKRSEVRWTSSCPGCGGDYHTEPTKRGEPSDRCVWFLEGRQLGYCFQCRTIWWPDQAPGYTPPTAEALADWRQRREEELEERLRTARQRLDEIRSSRVWEQYWEHMGERGRVYWRQRGIPDAFQDFWQLGWRPEWRYRQPDGSYFITPSATIPLFDHNMTVLNIKHRFINPPPQRGKYKYEWYGVPQPMFLCNPDEALAGQDVIAIEGELKAATTFATLDSPQVVMVGLPGTNPGRHIIEALRQAGRVTLVFDPGAEVQARALADAIGRKMCRILIPHEKIDDAIVASNIDKWALRRWLRQAEFA